MFYVYLFFFFSGIQSVNLMPMMRNTVALHVKGSAIVPFVVVNGVNHTLESGPAMILHHHQHVPGSSVVLVLNLSSSSLSKRTYLLR